MKTIGSRAEVMHGKAKKTSGGLQKKHLKYNKRGKIVSKKASKTAKKNNRLVKYGYITKKGVFGTVKKQTGGNIFNKGDIAMATADSLLRNYKKFDIVEIVYYIDDYRMLVKIFRSDGTESEDTLVNSSNFKLLNDSFKIGGVPPYPKSVIKAINDSSRNQYEKGDIAIILGIRQNGLLVKLPHKGNREIIVNPNNFKIYTRDFIGNNNIPKASAYNHSLATTQQDMNNQLPKAFAYNHSLAFSPFGMNRNGANNTCTSPIFSLWFHNIGFQEFKKYPTGRFTTTGRYRTEIKSGPHGFEDGKLFNNQRKIDKYVDKYINYFLQNHEYLCINEYPKRGGHHQASIINRYTRINSQMEKGNNGKIRESRYISNPINILGKQVNLMCLHSFVFSDSTSKTQVKRSESLLDKVVEEGNQNSIICGDFNLPIDNISESLRIISDSLDSLVRRRQLHPNQVKQYLTRFSDKIKKINKNFKIFSVSKGETTNSWSLLSNGKTEQEHRVDFILISCRFNNFIGGRGYTPYITPYSEMRLRDLNKLGGRIPDLNHFDPDSGDFLPVHDHIGFSFKIC